MEVSVSTEMVECSVCHAEIEIDEAVARTRRGDTEWICDRCDEAYEEEQNVRFMSRQARNAHLRYLYEEVK
jgi:transposase-like protein